MQKDRVDRLLWVFLPAMLMILLLAVSTPAQADNYFSSEQRYVENPVDPNGDLDGDGVSNKEEGEEVLPGDYGQEAYANPNLCTLMTKAGRISMKINLGRFRNVHALDIDDPNRDEYDPNRPEKNMAGVEFPYGFISFRIEDLAKYGKDKEVELKVLFPDKIDAHAEFYRYHDQQWYLPGIKHDIEMTGGLGIWKYDVLPDNPEYYKRSIILTLKDNDPYYDSDIENDTDHKGVIEDPWGLGVPNDSGLGRCFIGTLLTSP